MQVQVVRPHDLFESVVFAHDTATEMPLDFLTAGPRRVRIGVDVRDQTAVLRPDPEDVLYIPTFRVAIDEPCVTPEEAHEKFLDKLDEHAAELLLAAGRSKSLVLHAGTPDQIFLAMRDEFQHRTTTPADVKFSLHDGLIIGVDTARGAVLMAVREPPTIEADAKGGYTIHAEIGMAVLNYEAVCLGLPAL